MEASDNILVCARVRPPTQAEGGASGASGRASAVRTVGQAGGSVAIAGSTFSFDHVAGVDATQVRADGGLRRRRLGTTREAAAANEAPGPRAE